MHSLCMCQMSKQGFRNFVGVDGSKGMLLEAEKTGLYRSLELAVLGPETLPVATGTRQRSQHAAARTASFQDRQENPFLTVALLYCVLYRYQKKQS